MAVTVTILAPHNNQIVPPGTIPTNGTVDAQASVTATLKAQSDGTIIHPTPNVPVITGGAWNFLFLNVTTEGFYDLSVTAVSTMSGTGVSKITIQVLAPAAAQKKH
jgi:hypothetical protein